MMVSESQSDGVPMAVPRMGCTGVGGVGRRVALLHALLSTQFVFTRWGLVEMVSDMVRWLVVGAVR